MTKQQTISNPFSYLQPYAQFKTVQEMDQHVKAHVRKYYSDLKPATREVLFNIARHALQFAGAAHLKAETIANEIGMSTKSVYRAVRQLTTLGIVKKENTARSNKLKGANIYSITPCDQLDVLLDVPSEMSYREGGETPCGSKVEKPLVEAESLISLSTKKSLKNTNITEYNEKNVKFNSVDKEIKKEEIRKTALLSKVPSAMEQVELFFDNADEIYEMNGVIFLAKNTVSKSIRIEEHEDLFARTIKNVFEYYTRKVKDIPNYNVFGLMYKAVKELCEKIMNGTAYAAPEKDRVINGVTQKMIDEAADVFEKQRLMNQRDAIKTKKLNNNTKIVPEWLNDNKAHWERVEAERQAAREAQYAGMTEEEHLEQVLHKLAEVAGMSVEEFKAAQAEKEAQEAAQAKKVEPVVVEDDEDLEAYRQLLLAELNLA